MRSATAAERPCRVARALQVLRRRLGDDLGGAAAEFAVALPAVALVLAIVLGGAQLAGLQLRAADAAADAARGFARGESSGTVAARVAAQLPGAGIDREDRGELVCVRVSVPTGGALARFGMPAAASGCALAGGG